MGDILRFLNSGMYLELCQGGEVIMEGNGGYKVGGVYI